MEWNEKLQELRKQKGLTQEELAAALFVSRPAVSKWESGRGYPNIDSLKAIAKFFGITIDELLSGDELLTIAEEDSRAKEHRSRDLVFGLLDCSAALLLFLPFFGQRAADSVQALSLLSLTGTAPYLREAYLALTLCMTLWGILMLALQNVRHAVWVRHKISISLIFHAAGTLLFIISSQPYAAAFMFVFLLIKALMLLKQ